MPRAARAGWSSRPAGPAAAPRTTSLLALLAAALLAAWPSVGRSAEDAVPPPPPAGAGAAGSADTATPAATPVEPASSSPAPQAPAWIRLRGTRVFELRAAHDGVTPEARARAASEALTRAFASSDRPGRASVEAKGGRAVVRLAGVAVVDLGPEDAAAAGGGSYWTLATSAADGVDEVVAAEARRRSLQDLAFSISLAVFSGLVAFLLLRRLGRLEDDVERWIEARPERLPALSVKGVEVASPAAVRGAMRVALRALRLLAQVAVAWIWLLFALSVFPQTAGTGAALRDAAVAPVTELLGRLGNALPLVAVGVVALVGLWLVLRSVRLFLGSVARGETHVGWLSADLAGPVSVVLRGAIVVAAIAFAAPLVGGSDRGALATAGGVVLAAVGLAVVPLLATVALGLPRVFGRALRPGDRAEVGGRRGLVREVGLLEIRLRDEEGGEVRVSHLAASLHPAWVAPTAALGTVEVVVAAEEDPERVRDVLLMAAAVPTGSAELLSLDRHGARWVVRGASAGLGVRVASVLAKAGIRLGPAPRTEA